MTYFSVACPECTSFVMLNKPISFPYYHTFLPGGGRTTAMMLQGDVELFTYDAGGRMLTANNRSAQVSRAYAPNGALTQEVLRIRQYDPTEEISSSPFSQHVFTTNYVADVSGRRISRSDWLNRTQTYTYHDSLGMLIRVADKSTGGGDSTATHFSWNAAGSLIGKSVGSVMAETRVYDAYNRLISRDNSIGFEDDYTYDARGKQKTRYSAASAQFLTDSSTMWYDGFGAVAVVDRQRILGGQDNTVDEFHADALGNVTLSDQNRAMNFNRTRAHKQYEGERVKSSYSDPLTTLREPATHMRPLIKNRDSTEYFYDLSGNQSWTRTRRWVYADSTIATQSPKGGYTYQDFWKDPASPYKMTRSFYDAANRLRQYEQNNHSYGPWHTVQEYRYDALGRRVLLRTRRDSTTCNATGASENSPACLSSIERFVWDGDQLVTEYRRPGRWDKSAAALDSLSSVSSSAFMGTVRYVHALGIDDPILVEKIGASGGAFIPHRSGRGGFEAGTYVSSGNDMTAYTWPARYEGIYPGNDARLETPAEISWFGSLLDGKADMSGLIYMRNRYFDPGTGRFTQPDPIGLAGGLNLYGYAGGDPINRSDPFGLCAEGADSTQVTVQCPDGSQETQYATTSVASAAETAALLQALAAMSYDGAGIIGLLGNAAIGALASSVSGGYGKFSATSTQGYPVITAAGFGSDGYLYLRDDVSALATRGSMNAMVPVPTGTSTMSVCTAVGHEGFHAIGMGENMHSAIAVLQGGFRCR